MFWITWLLIGTFKSFISTFFFDVFWANTEWNLFITSFLIFASNLFLVLELLDSSNDWVLLWSLVCFLQIFFLQIEHQSFFQIEEIFWFWSFGSSLNLWNIWQKYFGISLLWYSPIQIQNGLIASVDLRKLLSDWSFWESPVNWFARSKYWSVPHLCYKKIIILSLWSWTIIRVLRAFVANHRGSYPIRLQSSLNLSNQKLLFFHSMCVF